MLFSLKVCTCSGLAEATWLFKHVGSIQEHYSATANTVYSVKKSTCVPLTSAGLYKKKSLRSSVAENRDGITAEDRSGIKRPSASYALVGNNPGCGCPAELPPRCFSSQICRRLSVGYAPQHHRASKVVAGSESPSSVTTYAN